jgi:hypothetical protein
MNTERGNRSAPEPRRRRLSPGPASPLGGRLRCAPESSVPDESARPPLDGRRRPVLRLHFATRGPRLRQPCRSARLGDDLVGGLARPNGVVGRLPVADWGGFGRLRPRRPVAGEVSVPPLDELPFGGDPRTRAAGAPRGPRSLLTPFERPDTVRPHISLEGHLDRDGPRNGRGSHRGARTGRCSVSASRRAGAGAAAAASDESSWFPCSIDARDAAEANNR